MKRNRSASHPITSSDLSKFGSRLNKQFEKIQKQFILMDQKNLNTERLLKMEMRTNIFDLTQRLERNLQAFIQVEIKELSHKLEEKISKFTNLIITTIDPLLKELETRQEDREIAAQQMFEARTQLENQEKRIKRLEESRITV